jgi:hypothetical protein
MPTLKIVYQKGLGCWACFKVGDGGGPFRGPISSLKCATHRTPRNGLLCAAFSVGIKEKRILLVDCRAALDFWTETNVSSQNEGRFMLAVDTTPIREERGTRSRMLLCVPFLRLKPEHLAEKLPISSSTQDVNIQICQKKIRYGRDDASPYRALAEKI